jgi:acetoin utilization deacetylase AcuC-like enzyme
LKHETGKHPECAERLEATVKHLKDSGIWAACEHPPRRMAGVEEICLVHSPEYVQQVIDICKRGGGFLDADTVLSSASYNAAACAVGLTLQAVEWVQSGQAKNAFALVRPPGHHASASAGMGFCIFNNVAIAARYLQKKFGVTKILIVDWDVHHGNGTQDIFYDDAAVLCISAHAYPFYPGTGGEGERGTGAGTGFTINLPVTPGISPERYLERVAPSIRRRGKEFSPEFVLVSAGFDAVAGDPIGVLKLDAQTFEHLTRTVNDVAAECCGGRLVSVLEGGYDLTLLPQCAAAHVRVLMEEKGFNRQDAKDAKNGQFRYS